VLAVEWSAIAIASAPQANDLSVAGGRATVDLTVWDSRTRF